MERMIGSTFIWRLLYSVSTLMIFDTLMDGVVIITCMMVPLLQPQLVCIALA